MKYEDGRTNVVLNPAAKPVKVTVQVKGEPEAVKQAWEKFFNFGEPLEATEGIEVTVTGSPLFAEFGGKLQKVESTGKLPVHVTISVTNGEKHVQLPAASVPLLIARKRLKVTWAQTDCPLQLRLVIDLGNAPARLPEKTTGHFEWQHKVWAAKSLTLVPWLDLMNRFLEVASDPKAATKIEIAAFGNPIMASTANAPFPSSFAAQVAGHTKFLIKAREVDALLRLGLRIPKRWRKGHFDDILELHDLFSKGRFEYRNRWNFGFSMKLTPGQPEPDFNAQGPFVLSYEALQYRIWGKRFWMYGPAHELFESESVVAERVSNDPLARRIKIAGARRALVWTQCPWPKPIVSRLRTGKNRRGAT